MKKFICIFLTTLMLSFTSNQERTSLVSWYGYKERRITASGEVLNNNSLTAAHKTLRFGTKVLVTNLENGKSVTVRINDRGPFVKNRILDLSKGAFQEISNLNKGVIKIKYSVIK